MERREFLAWTLRHGLYLAAALPPTGAGVLLRPLLNPTTEIKPAHESHESLDRVTQQGDFSPHYPIPALPEEPKPEREPEKVVEPPKPEPQPTPIAPPAGLPQRFLATQILPRTQKYGIPNPLAAGQWANESRRAVNLASNNYWGLGPGRWYQSLDAGVQAYYLTLKNITKAKGFDFDQMDDSVEILQVLQKITPRTSIRYETHNSDPNTYINLITGTPEFKFYNSLA